MERFNTILKKLDEEDLDTLAALLEWKNVTEFYTGTDYDVFICTFREKMSSSIPLVRSYPGSRDPKALSYVDILQHCAFLIGVDVDTDLDSLERSILEKIGSAIRECLSPSQLSELEASITARIPPNKTLRNTLLGSLPLMAILAGEAGGFATYMATTSIVGTIASWIGITLPFATYTSIAATLSTFLGPVGWVASGTLFMMAAGAAAVGWKTTPVKIKKYVSLSLFLIAIKAKHEEKVKETKEGLQRTITLLEGAERDASKGADAVPSRAVVGLRKQVRHYKKVSREIDLDTEGSNRETFCARRPELVVRTGGDHHSIFGDMMINTVSDIPHDGVRELFLRISEHAAVMNIRMGPYNQKGRGVTPPQLRLRVEEGRLVGTLIAKGIRQNGCKIQISVREPYERSVMDHIRDIGALRA